MYLPMRPSSAVHETESLGMVVMLITWGVYLPCLQRLNCINSIKKLLWTGDILLCHFQLFINSKYLITFVEFTYLDESGDLGPKGSKTLVLTLVCTKKKKKLEAVVVNAKKRLLGKKKGRNWLARNGGEIKFHSFPDKPILLGVLKDFSNIEMSVYYYVIHKKGRRIDSTMKTKVLTRLLFHIVHKQDRKMPEQILADLNFFGKKKRNQFILVEKNSLSLKETEEVAIDVQHFNSRFSEALQATDLISGCCFQHSENNNPEFLDILSSGKIEIDLTEE